jgi:hypothetical protein
MTDLYLVYVPDSPQVADIFPEWIEVDRGLYLLRSARTRSQLYHAIKRKVSPAALLVAPLADPPKFKGMRRGATREMRTL